MRWATITPPKSPAPTTVSLDGYTITFIARSLPGLCTVHHAPGTAPSCTQRAPWNVYVNGLKLGGMATCLTHADQELWLPHARASKHHHPRF